MTPSEAHDTAYTRTPEHDEMVASVYEFLQERGCPFEPGYRMRYGDRKKIHTYANGWAECEKMYVGKRTFFADVAVVRWSDDSSGYSLRDSEHRYSHHLILEIKPKIYSAGAVLRQVKAQQNLINEWCEDLTERNGDKSAWGTAAPVFKRGDPLIDLFERMIEKDMTYFVWDAASGLTMTEKKPNAVKAAA